MILFPEENEDKFSKEEFNLNNSYCQYLSELSLSNHFNVNTLNEEEKNTFKKVFNFVFLNEETNTGSTKNNNQKINNDYQENNTIIKDKINNEFKVKYIKIQNELRNFLNNKIDYPINEKEILLGRKRKISGKMGLHNKFSDDNLIRKIKGILVDNLYNFINTLLKDLYGNNKIQLLIINPEQIKNSKVDFNIKFLDKTLKDIFSYKISTKYRSKSSDYNEKIINNLCNEEDVEKKIIFEKLFNLNFLQCLKHFREDLNINELKGLVLLDECYKKFIKESDYEMYIKIFEFYSRNFEEILKLKKGRKAKKD